MSNRDYRDMDLLRQMETEMQRIADEALRGFLADAPAPHKFWHPRADVHETTDAFVVKVEICGVKPEQLGVSLSPDGRVLTIAGSREESDEERAARIRCYQLEIYFGPFERQLVLPPDARIERDAITASFREGFLVVTLPKRGEPEPEQRNIPVT